jgi:hypothetical protein
MTRKQFTFPCLSTFGKHAWLGNNAYFLVCPPLGNMARKRCFLVCLPLGNKATGNNVSWFVHLRETCMARKQCFLVCPPSGNIARKRQCFLVFCFVFFFICPPLGNMARKQLINVPWFVHLWETWIGNNFSWFVHLWETWLGNNVPWFLHLRKTWLYRKQYFLICQPLGDMARKQCFLFHFLRPSGVKSIKQHYFHL